MKKLIFQTGALTIACFTTILLGCGKDGGVNLDPVEEKCGLEDQVHVDYMPYVNSTVEGGIREFILEDVNTYPQNICTEEHPTVNFWMKSQGSAAPEGMTLYGKCYWSIYKTQQQMIWKSEGPNNGAFFLEMKPGLKDAFPDKPGYLYGQIIIKFPSRGGHAVDSAYVDSVLYGSNINFVFKKHKS